MLIRAGADYSPELKKEEWSVYVLDQNALERMYSGNGTITSVLNGGEAVPVIGKVKKKFRREMLDIELRLVKVPHLPMPCYDIIDERFLFRRRRNSPRFRWSSYCRLRYNIRSCTIRFLPLRRLYYRLRRRRLFVLRIYCIV